MGNKEVAEMVRRVAVNAIDAKEPKTPVSECSAEGGPENCPYHKQFVHKEGEGLKSYYNTRKVVTENGKEKYIDTGAAENKKHL